MTAFNNYDTSAGRANVSISFYKTRHSTCYKIKAAHLSLCVKRLIVVHVCSGGGGKESLVPVRVGVWEGALLHLCLCSRDQLQPLGHVISHRYGSPAGIRILWQHCTAIRVEISNRVSENEMFSNKITKVTRVHIMGFKYGHENVFQVWRRANSKLNAIHIIY